MFARRKPVSAVADLARVEAAVRERFGLDRDRLVLVTEERARPPDLPQSATTVLFWTAAGLRHRLRIFKPAAAIAPADLPPVWLRGALVDEGDNDCC